MKQRQTYMKTHNRAVLVSAVLFTLSLLYLVPAAWNCATAGWHTKLTGSREDVGWQVAAQLYGQLGLAGLTIVAIGLVVAWTGFIHRVRWAWFVALIIVWVSAFPMLVLPLLLHTVSMAVREGMWSAFYEVQAFLWTKNILVFLMMFLSLVIPVRAFFKNTATTT